MKIGAILGSLAIAVCGAAYLASEGTSESAHKPPARRPAPAFRLPDSKGVDIGLGDLKGQAALIHFWASWCPPCLEETPNFLKLAQDLTAEPVKFVAVSIDDAWPEARKILNPAALPGNFISLLDLSKKVPEAYGTYQYPETYLLNRDQQILLKWVGPQDWASPMIREAIHRAAAG